MENLDQIKKVQDSIFKIEDMLKKIIAIQGEITKEPIAEFDTLISEFKQLGDLFFNTFEKDYVKQIITFGTITTTNEICKGLRDNLEDAKARGENPIAAERVIDKNYLGVISIILENLGKVYSSKTITEEEYETINNSVRNLFKMSLDDSILSQEQIKFSNKESEQILSETINESAKSLAM